jgi:GR25 family glycosyltransferase involved in LPS biosynthesis
MAELLIKQVLIKSIQQSDLNSETKIINNTIFKNIQEYIETPTKIISNIQANGLEYLKHGYYINLKDREDRNRHTLKQFQKLNIPSLNMVRMNAYKHQYGAIGCYLSHLNCLKNAKKNGYDHILICEDDITFANIPILKHQLTKVINQVDDWDVLMIASNIIEIEKIQDVNYYVRVKRGMAGTGYIVKSHYYDKLIDNFTKGIALLSKHPHLTRFYALDVYWFSLQETDKWIIPIPLSVSQYSNFSNIENKVVNYNSCMLKNIK